MRTANLCLHTGANTVTRDQLVATATPERTNTWVPIPHAALLGQVQASLQQSGLHVVNESHALGNNGNRYFGLLQVANGNNSDEFGLVCGLRNSHDMAFPAGLVLGASVLVCDNLSFSGEFRIARKHTAHILRDLPSLVSRAVGGLVQMRHAQDLRFSAYKATDLSEAQANDLIVRTYDAGIVPITKIPDLINEWRKPRHDEFAQSRNVWRLFNAATEISKGSLSQLPKRTMALHGLLDLACGLLVPHGEPEVPAATAV